MVLRWYQAKLAQRPLLTQAVTTAVLFGAGDGLAQQAVERKGLQKHDLQRTARMAAYGGLVFGPAATKWYQFLQKNVNLGSKTTTTIARVAADQLVFATTNMAIFLSTMAYLEGESPRKRLEKAYLPGLKANWAIWPAVQGVNFTVVPLEHRVLVVNIVSLGWNCYLSYLNAGSGS
ncbi:Protein required for ethanol metabolism [Lithohypha guttulata]|uniref:Protein required for ethanol metabolism n=1 Tax=Lithohypha guttulata TaxID=1690604 RepID=A0AAN7Y9R7_9EURO|nr:Protein required for ethanol metabolism [Lithohypha guttulata]KAK5090450.1 Protein required for ethanol metabolism [Lithohypha guttulata]KAK5104756.1 Protein required for ethanol metabolism [Lithohypha guttulata]